MKLMTKANRKALPELYANEGKGFDAITPVKFFSPVTGWTWFITEFDGHDTLFGYCAGNISEWGYTSLHELESADYRGMSVVERDLYWKPKTVKQALEGLGIVGVQ